MKRLAQVVQVSYLLCGECSGDIECCNKCGLPFIVDEEIICYDEEVHLCNKCEEKLHNSKRNTKGGKSK